MAAPTWVDFYNQLTARAQQTSAARASDPTAGISWSRSSDQYKAASNSGGKSVGDRLWNDNLSVGKRVIDILSRGNYAAANFKKYQLEHEAKGDNELSTLLGAVGAAGRGLAGTEKTTFKDVTKPLVDANPWIHDARIPIAPIGYLPGVGKKLPSIGADTALNLGLDIGADPTTYVGPGGIIKGVKALKATGKTAKITEAAVQPVAKRVAEELGTTGKATVPEKSAEAFLRDVTRNFNNPGDAFDNVVETAKASPLPTNTERVFNVGSNGVTDIATKTPSIITDERFMLPSMADIKGGADVVAGRASVAKLNNLAKGIPQFHYGSAIDQLDEFGPFRQTVERVPVNDVPQVRPKGSVAPDNPWADLPEVKNDNRIRNAILRKNDEKVFSAYETFKDPATGVEAFRPAKGAYETTIGDLRRAVAKGDKNARFMLQNHLNAVENYAKNLAAKGADATGYGTAEGYIKDMYPAEYEAARVALGGRKAAGKLDLTDLPEGPMAVKPKEPTYKEITKIQKMDMVDKFAYLQNLKQTAGLSESDVAYLASASNPKSFATRMQKLKTKVREQGTQDIHDLVDAINSGRIQSVDEPGIKELLDATGAKSLSGLARKLSQQTERLSKAEKKILGDVTGAVTKESRPVETGLKELGPTGLPYSAYSGRAVGALEEAQKIAAQKVLPAAEIVQSVKAGDTTALAKTKSTLNVSQSKVFDGAMKWAVEHEVIQPRNKELWAFATKRGTLRTAKVMNQGAGRNAGAWNKYSQYTFFKNMMQNAEKIDPQIKQVLDSAGVRGADRGYARSAAMYETMMPVLKAMDDVLKQGGVFPVADKAIGDNPFSLFDVLHAVSPDFAKRYVFSMRTTKTGTSSIIAPTQLMDVMNYFVDVMKQGGKLGVDDVENAKKLLMEEQVTRNGRPVPNGLRAMLKGKKPEEINAKLDEVVSELADAVPEIVARNEANMAQRKIYHEEQVSKGTKKSLETLADIINDPAVSPGDIAGLASKVKVKVVDKVTRLTGIDPNDAWMVGQEVQAKLPDLGMPPEVQAQGHLINQMAGATTKAARAKAGIATSKLAEEESAKLAQEIGVPLSDLGTRIEMSMGWKLLKAFSPHLGNAQVRPFFLDRKSLSQNLGRGYQALLSEINAKHTKDAIAAAWKENQLGARSANPEIAAAQDDLHQAINTFFSADPEYNVFARNNISAADVNAHFAHFKIHEKFAFTDETLNDAWRSWDTENPLDLLGKTQAATMAAMSKRLLGDDLSFRFGSATQQAGYVKLSPHNSILGRYLDLEQYYPRDIAKQFKVLDDFLKQSMEPAKFNAMTNFLDNVLHSYKAGLTIYRPGHHVRNMVGDVWLAHMAGVNDPRYYTKAAKVMAQNHGRYRDFDAMRALMARQPVDVKPGKFIDNGEAVVNIRIGGKSHKLSSGDVYRAAYDSGILNDYRTLEDIQMGAESFSDKLRQISPFKGKLNRGAASFSEARDHYVRLAHFMNDLEKGNWRTVDEAITKSAHNVRKWHPDGSDLTKFESTVMRRSFLFYSWIRKAMPLVVESMVMHPGKVMIYPKAMYNLAESNGIDLESMSNPYPTDQMFPDWITDSPIGPIMQNDGGHYLGVNPGVPMVDVMNDYAGNQAGRTIMGSTNPFIKIPTEMISAQGSPAVATDWRTGVKSYDTTDYIDRQIPFGTYLVGLTGKSPSSGFTQNKGGKAQASPNEFAFSNLLSGLGLFDMSKPGYQKQAQKDAKARYMQSGGN